MANLLQTYQHIADILSFKSATATLEKTLSAPSFDWDSIVMEGSKHLVLPALYCRLKSKQLLHVLPEELHDYLKELTAMNRTRNAAIMTQVRALITVFETYNISYVLLKGTALLASGLYEDNAERMIGDIDIIVPKNQINKAFQLLLEKGYFHDPTTFGSSFFESKHLPRLKTTTAIAAVELHQQLFVRYKDPELCPQTLLQRATPCHSIYIPTLSQLLKHTILNFQINDHGNRYHSINFRSLYDSMVLTNKGAKISVDTPVYKNYFKIAGIFCSDFDALYSNKNSLTARFYRYKLTHLNFYKYWNYGLRLSAFTGILCHRFTYFLTNKAYRHALIRDRRRVFKSMKSHYRKT